MSLSSSKYNLWWDANYMQHVDVASGPGAVTALALIVCASEGHEPAI